MSFQFDETHVYDGQHLVCPENKVPIALGVALTKIKGSQYVQGPSLFGADKKFPTPYATVMITPPAHSGLPTLVPGATAYGPPSNPFSLAVTGASAFLGNVETSKDVIVGGALGAQGDIISNCGVHVLSAKKNFDIPHPTKEGWRLRHTCRRTINDVYLEVELSTKIKSIYRFGKNLLTQPQLQLV